MQGSASGKKKPKIVTKPLLTGSMLDGATAKRALRVAGSMLVTVFVYLVFGSLLIIENLFLRLLANGALILMCGGLLYMSGASQGEADAAFGEIMYQREKEGKPLPDSERARCFHPLKGLATAFLGASPFVLLALVSAVTVQIATYSLGALPGWLSSYQRQGEIGSALGNYQTSVAFGVLDIVQLASRLMILPYISMAGAENAAAVLVVQRLAPILVLLIPGGYALGYLRGREMRARVHTSIAQSKRKKKSRDKKEQQRRQQKGPEQLI
jgi:hypothetical protein